MALTIDQITQITSLQTVVTNFVSLLNTLTYQDPVQRAASGVSDANIVNLNTTVEDVLAEIDNILSTDT